MRHSSILSFLFCFSTIVFGQTGPVYDNIPDRDVITIEQTNGSGQIKYGFTTNQVIVEFGNPDDISTVYWEMSDVTATYYQYNDGIRIAFVDGKVDRFKLTSSNYLIRIDSNVLKVGNHKNTLQAFPLSYSNFTPTGGTAITLDHGDHDYLSISTSNNTIQEIHHLTF